MDTPAFASIGRATGIIDVRLSYKIIELFSEGLYASPNKAIEELVANSFDAGAQRVQVLLSPNLHDQDSTIVVIDDGEGMDDDALREHWLIGVSNKRRLAALPLGRQQIGKFGIGKLATYVLANRLTHITKRKGKYFSTSMDYGAIDRRVGQEVEPRSAIRIPLLELSESQAKNALNPWITTKAFKESGMSLFGKRAAASWTVAIMSSLKEKVHEIRIGTLEWILRTALPLRPDFRIWLNGNNLESSKKSKGLIKTWIIGKDLTQLPKPSPRGITRFENKSLNPSDEQRFGFNVPIIGRVSGYAEAYKDLLTGKSDELGRSNGFFVYVRGRLINAIDGHFGISPDELRHGTFGRFRLVIHMDGLDQELRSNREAISEGPLLSAAQDVLRAIFNAVRPTLDQHDKEEATGAKLARKLAASPASLSRLPIVELTRDVLAGKAKSQYLLIPDVRTANRNALLASLERRAKDPDQFITGLTIEYDGSAEDGIAKYDIVSGALRINAWHPFVATFYDEFAHKGSGQPLELLAMAEVLIEAHMHSIGISPNHINDFLSYRDQLLRSLANESGRQSAFGIALSLHEARNNPDRLEEKLCAAFRSLGFEVTPIGKKGNPDGVATAFLSADNRGKVRQYAVSLESKSKEKDKGKISASRVIISAIIRQRDKYNCQHALVVGRSFPTTQGNKSALAIEIDDDRTKTAELAKAGKLPEPRTITLITINDLATLVKLRPVKQIGLVKLRELFQCRLPEESFQWVESIRMLSVARPPYRRIISAIELLQKKFKKSSVKYAALRVELGHLSPPIEYETDEHLKELCNGMAQMAAGGMYAGTDSVELDQSAANVIATIDAAMREYNIDVQKSDKSLRPVSG